MIMESQGASASGRRRRALLVLGIAIILVLAVASTVAFVASRQSGTTPAHSESNPAIGSPIKIGFITEITTGNAVVAAGRIGLTPVPDGYAARIGAELAVNQTNAAGGVDGRQIELIIKDSQSSPQIAGQEAQSLDQDGVLAITGPTNQEDALAMAAYTESHGVPFVVSSLSSAVVVEPGSNWTVSVQPDAVQWGAALAKYVSEAVPGARIALMTENADQQKEMAAGVRWYADTYGNESLVFDQIYDNAQFPWATAAEAARFSGANAVVVSWVSTAGFSEANVVEALQSVGFSPSQIFVASLDDQVSDLGSNATGIRGVTLFDSAMAAGFPNATGFVSELTPYINGQANLSIPYCGVCPTEIGPNYYYSFLGMEMMINAMKSVLSTGQVLSRASFMAAMMQSTIVDAYGNSVMVGPSGYSTGTFYVALVGNLNADGATYNLDLLKSIRFAGGTVPSYQIGVRA